MIIDKEMGIVMSENEDETAWYNTAEGIRQSIKILKSRIAKSEKDIKLGAREIEQKFKNGAKESIKVNKQEIRVQKEFLKLAESKLNL